MFAVRQIQVRRMQKCVGVYLKLQGNSNSLYIC